MNNRLEEYRQLVQFTIKDITYIGTEISPCSLFINIIIVFGGEKKTISIPISDIEANLHEGAKFVGLIAEPLENILT